MAGNISHLNIYTHPKVSPPKMVKRVQEIKEKEKPEEPEIRLSRFLYIGKEYANYQPGYWFAHNYFIIKNVPSIEELADNEEKQLVPIELIIKVNSINCTNVHKKIFIPISKMKPLVGI